MHNSVPPAVFLQESYGLKGLRIISLITQLLLHSFGALEKRTVTEQCSRSRFKPPPWSRSYNTQTFRSQLQPTDLHKALGGNSKGCNAEINPSCFNISWNYPKCFTNWPSNYLLVYLLRGFTQRWRPDHPTTAGGVWEECATVLPHPRHRTAPLPSPVRLRAAGFSLLWAVVRKKTCVLAQQSGYQRAPGYQDPSRHHPALNPDPPAEAHARSLDLMHPLPIKRCGQHWLDLK